MILRYILPFTLVILTSCTTSDILMMPDKTNTEKMNTGSSYMPGSTDPTTDDLVGSGEWYTTQFTGLETKTIAVKHIGGTTTTIEFMNKDANSMRVIVTFPENASGANLRLSQIVMPDGNMDGPFGTDSTIPLVQSGAYLLRFRENMMTGDPWSGDAMISVTLMRK